MYRLRLPLTPKLLGNGANDHASVPHFAVGYATWNAAQITDNYVIIMIGDDPSFVTLPLLFGSLFQQPFLCQPFLLTDGQKIIINSDEADQYGIIINLLVFKNIILECGQVLLGD